MASSSTLDRRRINAPPNTKPFAGLTRGASKAKARSEAERRSVRQTFIQTGLVSHASGSAYLESSSVKVACAVYGPRQSSNVNVSSGSGGGPIAGAVGSARNYRQEAELNVDVRFATFASRQRKRAGKDTESPSLASVVRLALLPSIRLDRLPKATVDVYITVIQADASAALSGVDDDDDEACAAAAATVASCALADAGIELYALVVGAHAVYDRSGAFIVDATHDEVDLALGGRGSVSLCAMPALGTVTWTEQKGQMSLTELERAMDVLQKQLNGVHLTAAKAIQRGLLARQQQV